MPVSAANGRPEDVPSLPASSTAHIEAACTCSPEQAFSGTLPGGLRALPEDPPPVQKRRNSPASAALSFSLLRPLAAISSHSKGKAQLSDRSAAGGELIGPSPPRGTTPSTSNKRKGFWSRVTGELRAQWRGPNNAQLQHQLLQLLLRQRRWPHLMRAGASAPSLGTHLVHKSELYCRYELVG